MTFFTDKRRIPFNLITVSILSRDPRGEILIWRARRETPRVDTRTVVINRNKRTKTTLISAHAVRG